MSYPLSVFIGLFVFFCIVDLFYSERAFPKVPFWKEKSFVALVIYVGLSTYSPYLWDAWFAEHRLIDATELPLGAGVLVGFLALEFGVYWWHRTLHAVPGLWRYCHRLHHSAERVDIYGAVYFHPIDILGFALIGSLALVLIVGVSAEAAVIAGLIANSLALFQHSNIKTPHWFGVAVMRPEAHAAHHERGVHRRNFGDIALFDQIFGTYENPRTFEGEVGFFDGSSRRWADVLRGRKLEQRSGPEFADGLQVHPFSHRDRIRTELSDAVEALLNSRAFIELNGPGLSAREVHYVFAQYERYVEFFPRALAMAAARIDDDALRMPLIRNLWEEHGYGERDKTHRAIYRRFLQALGHLHGPSDPRGGSAVIAFVQTLERRCEPATPEFLLGLLGPGTEDLTARLYRTLEDIARGRCGLPAAATEFFSLHMELDEDHAELFWDAIDDHLQRCGPQGIADVVAGARFAIEAEKVFWEAVVDEAGATAMASVSAAGAKVPLGKVRRFGFMETCFAQRRN